jgi:hypothetical protein
MKKYLFLLVILLAFTILIATPKDTVVADGAKLVYFTAKSSSLCPGDSRCNPGVPVPQPSGKVLITGYTEPMLFTASDPRWNAVCVFTADPMLWGNPNGVPVMGSFVCEATDLEFKGGGWKGTLKQVAHSDSGRWMSVWNAKGYGKFDGLPTTTYNTLSSKYKDTDPDIYNIVGFIKELPGHSQEKQ